MPFDQNQLPVMFFSPQEDNATYRLTLVDPTSDDDKQHWEARRCPDPEDPVLNPPKEKQHVVQFALPVGDVTVTAWGPSVGKCLQLLTQSESALAPRALNRYQDKRDEPPAAVTPLPSAQAMDERRQEQRHDAKLEQCPDHGLARRSKKSGGLFCPTSTEGGYCQWTNTQAA